MISKRKLLVVLNDKNKRVKKRPMDTTRYSAEIKKIKSKIALLDSNTTLDTY